MKIWNKILTYRKPKLHLVPKFCQLLQRIFCCQNSEYIWNIKGMERYRNLVSSITTMTPLHTVAIWIFTFHKKSGFVRVILKTNFNSTYRPNPSLFWAENSDLLYSFFFYFSAKFVKSNAFYYTCLNCYLMQKWQLKYVNSLK